MSTVNEALIRDIVSEVLGRLGGTPSPRTSTPPPEPTPDCGCNGKSHAAAPALRGKYGVFADANEACSAAHESFLQMQKAGVAARVKVVEIIKALCEKNAESWGRLELDDILCRHDRDHDVGFR